MMSASKAAKAAGVTTRQLQHWRETGALRPNGWRRPKGRREWRPCRYSELDVTTAEALGRISSRARYVSLRNIAPAIRLAIMQRSHYLAILFIKKKMLRVKILRDDAAVLKFASADHPGGVLILEMSSNEKRAVK